MLVVAASAVFSAAAPVRSATDTVSGIPLSVKVCSSENSYPMSQVIITLNPIVSVTSADSATFTWSVVGTQQSCTLPGLEYSVGSYAVGASTPGTSTPYARELQAVFSGFSSGIPLSTPSTSIRFMVTARKITDPSQTASSNEVSTLLTVTAPNAPTITSFPSPTNLTSFSLSGTKPANTGISVNGFQFVPVNANTTWTTIVNVPAGTRDTPITTTLSVVALDSHGVASATASADVVVPVKRPSTTGVPTSTIESSLSFDCGKAANTGVRIRVNSGSSATLSEVSTTTTCSGTVSLQPGSNVIELRAFTTSGEESDIRRFTVTRTSQSSTGGTVMPPTISTIASPTNKTSITVNGTKPAGASVLEHDVEIVPASASTTWSATVTIPAGTPSSPLASPLYFKAKDAAGVLSSVVTTIVTAPVGKPSVTLPTSTTSDRITVSCTKPANTGVKATVGTTGSVISTVGTGTTCNGTIPLAVGVNTVSFQAFTAGNEYSETVSYSVTRIAQTTATTTTTSGSTGSTGGANPVCGNRVVEGTEQCDPPNGTTCSSTCQSIGTSTQTKTTAICGNRIIEGAEQCDPPNGTTCSLTCQSLTAPATTTKTPVCGNWLLEGTEQCDPPNGTTCSLTCQKVTTPTSSAPASSAPASSTPPSSTPPSSAPPSPWTSTAAPKTDPFNPLPNLTTGAQETALDEWIATYFPGLIPKPDKMSLATRDSDRDGLSDLVEYQLGTNPTVESTAKDGVSDGDKFFFYHVDPTLALPAASKTALKISNLQTGLRIADPSPPVLGVGAAGVKVTIVAQQTGKPIVQLGNATVDTENHFFLGTTKVLTDGTYSFIATASVNGKQQTTRVDGVIIDTKMQLESPTPQKLDELVIPPSLVDLKLVTNNNRPALEGKVFAAARVEAYWQSFVTGSSLIADATSGEFLIQAPEQLEFGAHTVTVYAIAKDGTRSRSIRIPFTIELPTHDLLGADLGAVQDTPDAAGPSTGAVAGSLGAILTAFGAEITRRKGFWSIPQLLKRHKKAGGGDIPPLG